MFTNDITLTGKIKDDYSYKNGTLYVLRAFPREEEIERLEVDPPEEALINIIKNLESQNKDILEKIKREGVDEVNVERKHDSLKVKKVVFINMFDYQVFEEEFELKCKRQRVIRSDILNIVENIYHVLLLYDSVKREVEKELKNFNVEFITDPIIVTPILTTNIVKNINNFANITISETENNFIILPDFFSIAFEDIMTKLQEVLDDIYE